MPAHRSAVPNVRPVAPPDASPSRLYARKTGVQQNASSPPLIQSTAAAGDTDVMDHRAAAHSLHISLACWG
jgi:hypothetical protein